MTPPKETTKRLSISLSNTEVIEKLDLLSNGKSKPEFIAELLDCYEKFTGKNADINPSEEFFKNLKGEERKEKEPILKEIFELEPADPLLVSETQLLQKASEYSGKSIEEMSVEGRILIAKNLIGRHVQEKQNRGTKGKADDRIAQTYEFLKTSGQKGSINRLTQLSGSNRKTVESWCERNNIVFK